MLYDGVRLRNDTVEVYVVDQRRWRPVTSTLHNGAAMAYVWTARPEYGAAMALLELKDTT